MERQLPIADIAGTDFYVDVMREELRQVDNSLNRIPFSVITEGRSGYHFIYDPVIKNTPDDQVNDKSHRYLRVTLPALMELDPIGLSEKYAIPIEILSSGAYLPSKISAECKSLK